MPQRRRVSNTSWAGQIPAAVTAVAATTKVLIGGFSPSNAGITETILRTHVVGVGIPTAEGADVFLSLAFGMIVVTDLAAAAGAASIPGPGTDAGDDGWFVHKLAVARWEVADATGIAWAGWPINVESKAKRRVEEGFQIAVMVENLSASAAEVAFSIRLLSQVTGT